MNAFIALELNAWVEPVRLPAVIAYTPRASRWLKARRGGEVPVKRRRACGGRRRRRRRAKREAAASTAWGVGDAYVRLGDPVAGGDARRSLARKNAGFLAIFYFASLRHLEYALGG